MPSAVLIARPSEEVEVLENELGIKIVSVESQIDGLSLTGPAGGPRPPGGGDFAFDVEMTETGRIKDGLSVKYSLAFGRPASGQTCRVSGRAILHFSRLDPKSDLHALGSEIDNEMAVEIFRMNYETIYLLHQSLAMEAPSPWVTHGVSLSSRTQAV